MTKTHTSQLIASVALFIMALIPAIQNTLKWVLS